ncbi:hypothetical protein DGMP_38660 [Desulfomarina profundi]|uniref:Uncharacterized protein n=1 Tax=Desulfomarina profundi TaxID=2772557 RepID=A0A8D5FPZ3_9BACT|nr:hypothetical protein [Desulfomarina profundi]BCL63173.1 hypothetical protein DGMP_38660 [Desulfomarina profundi]
MTAAHQNPNSADNHILIAEIDPPKGANLNSFLDSALKVRGRVDAVRVTDSEHAIMRMSPLRHAWPLLTERLTRSWLSVAGIVTGYRFRRIC